MKEIQKLDNRVEVIMTYEGKRYKLNPDGLCYCDKCAFDKVPCSDLPMWEGSQPCADFGGGGFWEEIKDEQAVTHCNQLATRKAMEEIKAIIKVWNRALVSTKKTIETIEEIATQVLNTPPLYATEDEAFQAYLKEMEGTPEDKKVFFETWLFAKLKGSVR